MEVVLINFLAGVIGATLIVAIYSHLSKEKYIGAVFFVVVVGFNCGLMAHFISPWATPIILLLFSLVSINEFKNNNNGNNNGNDGQSNDN